MVRIRRVDDPEWSWARIQLVSDISAAGMQSVAVTLESAVRAGAGVVIGVLPLFVDYQRELVTGLLGSDEYEIDVAT
jgi:hypothetical protein